MNLGLYAMRDNVQGFLIPQAYMNDATALREFQLLCNKKETVYGFRPSDFSLYKIGEFDTETGYVCSCVLEVIG